MRNRDRCGRQLSLRPQQSSSAAVQSLKHSPSTGCLVGNSFFSVNLMNEMESGNDRRLTTVSTEEQTVEGQRRRYAPFDQNRIAGLSDRPTGCAS